jgi:hypothetical protein
MLVLEKMIFSIQILFFLLCSWPLATMI